MTDGERTDLVDSVRQAFELATRLGWMSHDPYDLLLSPFARPVQASSQFAARVLVQAGKRSGTGIRRLLRVPEHEEPKAISDFLRAATMLVRDSEWAAGYVDDLSHRLEAASIELVQGRGWGIGFPYASRFVNVGRGVPNLYVTTQACQALLDRYDLDGDERALQTAREGCRFILDGLGSFEHRGHRWLRYWAGSDTPTINVQASGASLLARASLATGDERFARTADEAVGAILSTQRADGSWPYSDDERGTFVDSFHTGFTLQGLTEYAGHRDGAGAPGVTEAIERGFAYFERHLLTPEGLPLGFADGKPSLDGQNVAQCIQTLVLCGRTPNAYRGALRLWDIGIRGLLAADPPGRTGPFPALRWTVGPAVLATAHLVRAAMS